MNLTHVQDENVRVQAFDMLHKHAPVRYGILCTIEATEHRTDLEPGTRTARSMPYRQGPAMREQTKTEIEKMLTAGVIEPDISEWTSLVVFSP